MHDHLYWRLENRRLMLIKEYRHMKWFVASLVILTSAPAFAQTSLSTDQLVYIVGKLTIEREVAVMQLQAANARIAEMEKQAKSQSPKSETAPQQNEAQTPRQ